MSKNALLKLLTSRINLTQRKDLVQIIEEYINSFEDKLEVSFLFSTNNRVEKFGHSLTQAQMDEVLSIEDTLDEFLGQSIDLKESQLKVFPIFKKNAQFDWIIVHNSFTGIEKIFIPEFFKYIENVNLLRSHKESAEDLKILASTDDVTGLYNQRKLTEDLEEAVKWHEKEHETFSIMFIDVDHFKNVNDDYGHIIGSKLLLDLGRALKLILRQTDHIYRYGGDEFVVIMPNVKTNIVYEVANRVLSQLKEHMFEIDNGDQYQMSLSIGIAEYPTDAKSAMEIIKFADEMMYKSKKSGRGKVFHVNEVANADASIK